MADLFISYSRLDKERVNNLYEALKRAGYSVWIDLQDIVPTAEWMKEIENAIAAANAIICVISTDFADSHVCQHELEYAFSLQKKFFPS